MLIKVIEKKEKPIPIKENLKQRAYLNSVTSVLDYGAKIITGFVVTPFLVSGLGSTLFGVWKVLGQFTSYTNLADIKATQVLKWAVARDRDTVDDEELREYVTATFLLVMLILPLILIAGAVIIWYSPQITGVEESYFDVVRITTALLLLALVIHKLFDAFESILRGMNLGFKRMGFRATVFVIGGGLQIIVMLLGYGLIALALIQILVNIVIGVTIYVIVKKNVPWFGFGKARFKKSLSFIKTSGWFMGWTGTNMLLLHSDKILLGYLGGPIIVTQYVITEYFNKAIRGTLGNVVTGIIPGIGSLYGKEEYLKLYKARKHIVQINLLFGITFGGVVILYNEVFVNLWIGSANFAGQTENLLLTLISLQVSLIYIDASIIKTTLDIKKKVYFGLISSVSSIGLAFILIPTHGIIGLCISILIGRSIINFYYPLIIQRKIISNKKLNMFSYRLLFIFITIWILSFYLSSFLTHLNWISLIGFGILTSIIFFLLVFYIGFDKKNRIELYEYKNKIKLFSKDDK